MVPPICNITVYKKLTSIIHPAEPYRRNVHWKLTPITRTAKPYRRELMPIIREPYSSNWTRDTRDVNEENAYLRGRIDKLNWQLDNANDEMEVDEEEARNKMKMILKTFD
ncbi:hypothetical protein C1646_776761 [Rhizophagus diaphanus]|nr:hypothetical protein C1646_776761 [Rhizophagus diaphanus] [Rhizophagus sp. MUCL 43196]